MVQIHQFADAALMLDAGEIDFAKFAEETDAHAKILPASAFVQDVAELFNPDAPIQGDKPPFRFLKDKLRFRDGEVTLWTGTNGHGKSLMLGQFIQGFLDQGKRCCIASMEMLPKRTLHRMAKQKLHANMPSLADVTKYINDYKERLWLYNQQGTVKPNVMLGAIKYAALEKGVKHFVVDSLMKCGINEDDYNGQKTFVDGLTSLARDHEIHIHLVAHARKGMDESTPPRKMDVRGSSSLTDQVDNCVTVWRNKKEVCDRKPDESDALLLCDKQRNGEWEGVMRIWFNPATQSYTEQVPVGSHYTPMKGAF